MAIDIHPLCVQQKNLKSKHNAISSRKLHGRPLDGKPFVHVLGDWGGLIIMQRSQPNPARAACSPCASRTFRDRAMSFAQAL